MMRVRFLWWTWAAVAALWLLAAPGWATEQLTLSAGEGKLLNVTGDMATVFVADPDVADVQSPAPGAVLVLGKKVGSTTLYALNGSGKPLLKQAVTVQHNLAEMQNTLHQRFPSLRLSLSSAPGSVMVSGAVPDAATADAVAQTIKPWLGEKESLVNRMSVASPVQVYLRVRVTEVSRSVTQQLGVNWGR